MAAVYEATHRNGSKIALKVLHTEFARDEGVRKRFLREGYLANKVQHPGIVEIMDDDETENGELFLVMELLEGYTLQQLWKKGKVDVPEALRVAREVLDTLVPFHGASIIHRDLKPANIFIINDRRVKLLDFGVAQLREEGSEAMTRAGTTLGTPSYMSPEQAMGKSNALDGRSDVFAVGATLYAVLSGKRLHYKKSDNEAFILAATQPAPSLARSTPDLPTEVLALVDKALQWDRRNRFADAGAMRDACDRLLEQLGGEANTMASASRNVTASGGVRPPVAGHTTRQAAGESHQTAASRASSHGTSAGRKEARRSRRTGRSLASGGQPRAQDFKAGSLTPGDLTAGALTPSNLTPGQLSPSQLSSQSSAQQHAPMPRASEGGLSVELDATGSHELDAVEPSNTARSATSRSNDKPGAKQNSVLSIGAGLFESLEKALPVFRSYGLEHPEAEKRISLLHKECERVHRELSGPIQFKVQPFCFTHGEETLWEPPSPFDVVPYNLSTAGLDQVTIRPGVSANEFRLFIRSIMIDAGDQAADDIAAAIWEARFAYVDCVFRDEVVEADAAAQDRFFAEAEELEQLAREDLAEVAAMAVSTETASHHNNAATSRALALDATTRRALASQLKVDGEAWRHRFYDVLAEGLADAAHRDQPPTTLELLETRVSTYISRERYRQALDVYQELAERLQRLPQRPHWKNDPGMLTANVFTLDSLRKLMRLQINPSAKPTERDRAAAGLRFLLKVLPASRLDDALSLANELEKGKGFEQIIVYIERVADGNEDVIVRRLASASPALAQRLLAIISESRSPAAIERLQPLLQSNNAALRGEAIALLATSPEDLCQRLLKILNSNDAQARAAALRTMQRHQTRAIGPLLIKWLERDEMLKASREEQRLAFETLYAIHPPRAESLLIDTVERHGLMVDEELDDLRTIAATILGERADSIAPLEALEAATKRRPWNTQALRIAAGAAAEQLNRRVTERKPSAPPSTSRGGATP